MPIESIYFTDAWSQTKEVIPVVFPIQAINYYANVHDVPGTTLLNDLNIV